ncbi:MAG TPA: SRPBCC domain-containing protein [Acidimicrobiales bacterium]
MADEHDVPTESVTRRVDLRADSEEVWAAIADPELRAAWLDDADAATRTVRIDAVDDGRRLVWTWWHDDDGGGAADRARVEIAVRPLDGGGTRVVVTETPVPTGPAVARASASASASTSVRIPGAVAGRVWDHRLLGLELLFVAAGACVL